jgi:hypothetical protein
VWWFIPIIPVVGRLRQEDLELEAGVGYTASFCLKQKVFFVFVFLIFILKEQC